MSARSLGGGRILGSGKGLAPPAAPRAVSPFARSESTVSLGSSSLSPPPSGSLPEADLGQDLSSRIRLGTQRKESATDGMSLICPICGDEMVTLLQLNRHIDDSHQELAVEEQDEVKTWFDKQVLKAKRFQPLSLINQKLRGLEVFESNEAAAATQQTTAGARISLDGPIDPDEFITRSHWQRSTSYDVCTDPACGKGLGPVTGSVNCRKCGRLFCEEHTMYQMKLSRSANHEPVRGRWARVCETCYKSRDGYNDHTGLSVDHMPDFLTIRRKKLDRRKLEAARLEKRLTKLARLLADPPANLAASASTFASPKSLRKTVEQSVVAWQEDETVPRCPFCQQEFGSWTFRRHHCRICGRVVCADSQTDCSALVNMDMANGTTPAEATMEKPHVNGNGAVDAAGIEIRMCRDCSQTIFGHRAFAASLLQRPPDQKAYETLRQFERGIRHLLPSFHRALVALQPADAEAVPAAAAAAAAAGRPSQTPIQEASKIRKRLIDSFANYASAAKRMRDLRTESETRRRLQSAVYRYASSFLHAHMLPLKSLPQTLRAGARSRPSPASASRLRHTELAGSEASSETSSLEAEEKLLRERLAVLEEQRFMVARMLEAASGARRFDEAGALSRNADELEAEASLVADQIRRLETRWEDLYRDNSSSS